MNKIINTCIIAGLSMSIVGCGSNGSGDKKDDPLAFIKVRDIAGAMTDTVAMYTQQAYA